MTETMDKKDAIKIYTLSKNTYQTLKDPTACEQLRIFAVARELGDDSLLLNSIELFERCQMLLQETERALTDNEMLELCELGIPTKERKELKETVAGCIRTNSNEVIKKIQEGCANNLAILPEYNEFVEYIYTYAK